MLRGFEQATDAGKLPYRLWERDPNARKKQTKDKSKIKSEGKAGPQKKCKEQKSQAAGAGHVCECGGGITGGREGTHT